MSEPVSWLRRDARRADKEGPAGHLARQRSRLAELVAFTRANSAYYGQLYRGLPDTVDTPERLPVTSKADLMARFDDWVTDPSVTEAGVKEFGDDPSLIGKPFLGKYLVATTSGTTSGRGLYLHDDRYRDVASAIGRRGMLAHLGIGGALRGLAGGGRFALLMATGGHFVSYAGYLRNAEESRYWRKAMRVFSVHTPVRELVEQLNEYRPAMIIGYHSLLMTLAGEQAAGRLRIKPVLVQPVAETVTASDRARLMSTFHTKVRPVYAATECTFLGYGCPDGWYHVNSDWVVLEPVDASGRPTPPGERSHTVLISNLANRVQPIIRYDLGDVVITRPDPCPCGSALPAIQVEGRAGEVLTFTTAQGNPVTIPSSATMIVFDCTPGVELFQILQTTPTTLRIRLRVAPGADRDQVWQRAQSQLLALFNGYDLNHITVDLADEPPQQSPGGKYRKIIPLPD